MSNGDRPHNFSTRGFPHTKVNGLRDYGQPSPCKVYKIINGVKTLERIIGEDNESEKV